MDNKRASFLRILARCFCRLIPFNAFSFLGGSGSGWHDSIPKTKVVDTSKQPYNPTTGPNARFSAVTGVPMKLPTAPKN